MTLQRTVSASHMITGTALVLFLVLSSSSAQNTTSSSYRVMQYDEPVMLDCMALSTLQDAVFRHWISPSLAVVSENFTHGQASRLNLLNNNFSLYIPAIQPKQMGDYLCYVEGAPEPGSSLRVPAYSRVTVYFYMPPIWERYYMNFVTALSAAAACLLLATLLCSINSLRWREAHIKIFEVGIIGQPSDTAAVFIGTPDHQLRDSSCSAERKVKFSGSDGSSVTTFNGCQDKSVRDKCSSYERETPM